MMHPDARAQHRRDGFKDRPRINEQIRVHYVRVIGADKKPIGILPIRDAVQMARSQGMDLVEIAPTADPPVCGIMDFGRFLYQQKIKERESRRKTHAVEVREVRFMMRISENDYQTKLKKVQEFLGQRDRVRITLRLRGREALHKDLAFKLIDRIRSDLAPIASVEGEPKVIGEVKQSIQVMFYPRHETHAPQRTENENPQVTGQAH
jgi:translation initiation factor IF-3